MTTLAASYEMIGRVLAVLIKNGLRRQNLAPKHLEILSDDRDSILHFADIMNWLKNENILAYSTVTLGCEYRSVQLTSKGIVAVDSSSFAELSGKSIREAVETAPEVGLSGDTYGKIGSLIGGVLGGFTQSF